jgi:hypothetical protein
MSGGGGNGGLFSDPLQTAVIIGASIAAPYAAPALFGAGAGLGTIALTGAGIGGLGSALIGRDPMMGALGGGLGGLGAGAAGVGASAAPSTLAASTAAPSITGAGATLAPTVVPGAIGNTAAASGFAGAGTLGGAGAFGTGTAAGTGVGLAAPSTFGVAPVAASNVGFLGASGAGGAGAAGSGGILGSMGVTPKMAGYGAGALGLMSMAGKERKQYGQPTTDEVVYRGGPLSKFTYDPNTYQADVVKPPTPPYQATYAAGGGLMGLRSFAKGGSGHLGGYSDGARVLKGPGDGMSDSIPATIEGKQPARLADSEFVVPADVVSHLGNGSSDAGAKKLYKMMDKVRKARTGNVKQAKRITAEKYLPA